jgi:DNA modification methylase
MHRDDAGAAPGILEEYISKASVSHSGRTLRVIEGQKIAIAHERTCDCPANHLNCMSAKDWIKSQLGVWQFYYEARDIRDKNVHPAVFPIAMAKRVIELYTHRGELVVDPFVGSGTTLIAARELDRHSIGFDINPSYIQLCKQRLSQVDKRLMSNAQQLPILDDARNVDEYLEPGTVSLIFTSPPYANLLNRPRFNKSRRGDLRQNEQYLRVEQYSQDPRDLGLLNIQEYQKALTEIYEKLLPLLKAGGHNVINVPDMWWREKRPGGGRRIPIHIHVYHAMVDGIEPT